MAPGAAGSPANSGRLLKGVSHRHHATTFLAALSEHNAAARLCNTSAGCFGMRAQQTWFEQQRLADAVCWRV